MIKIITISREFGSGGRIIGKEVVKRLGIPCYDKDFTDQDLGRRKNYHLSIDSGFLGIDTSTEVILKAVGGNVCYE